MRIKRRVGAFLAACTLAVASIVGISSPAFAWHYCSNTTIGNGMYLWPNQGYCPSNGGDYWHDPSGGSIYHLFQCYNITGRLDNGSGAAANTSGTYAIRYWRAYGCSGSANLSLAQGESTADLYPLGDYHNLSSFMWVWDA